MFSHGSRPASGECRRKRAYIATEAALVECDEGNPYSRLAEVDMEIR